MTIEARGLDYSSLDGLEAPSTSRENVHQKMAGLESARACSLYHMNVLTEA